ncbi:hypothetical protein SH668x_002919 [Planctomicrobium sp. SH668]|uniref:hypothetical protein n=1 Tax=Planctomicrobium sp. SH668 TaxID=3448126 RepID=UPI003F5C8B83
MALQKFRVTCPHCQVNLLVTEDLLGQPGSCPGCHLDFQLPPLQAFLQNVAEAAIPNEEPAATTREEPSKTREELSNVSAPPHLPLVPPVSTFVDETRQAGSETQLPTGTVKILQRPSLRYLAILLKCIGAFQVLVAFIILVVLLVNAISNPAEPSTVFSTVGLALTLAASSIFTLAFSELIPVFCSQETMLRHLLNEMRSRNNHDRE